LTERLYEGLFLVAATEAASEWSEIEVQIRALIENHGATIEYAERWPEQRLAYPVKGVKRGVYFLAYFTSDTGVIASIRSDGQLNEKILRMLIIQEDFLEVEMAKRKEAAARSVESAARSAAEANKPPAEAAEPTTRSEATDEGDTGETAKEAVVAEDLPATSSDAQVEPVETPTEAEASVEDVVEDVVEDAADEAVEEVASTEEETQ
jgi:small subunit ribosomal protein S6